MNRKVIFPDIDGTMTEQQRRSPMEMLETARVYVSYGIDYSTIDKFTVCNLEQLSIYK